MSVLFSANRKNTSYHYSAMRAMLSLIGALLYLTLTVPALGGDDLLMLPAMKSPRAAFSMLMDVVNTGKRLVAVGERGHILVSDDHGKSWVQADVPTSVTLTAVFFPSPGKGWAVGHDGVVLHTIDGGQSWAMQLNGSQINDLIHTQIEELLIAKKAELSSTDDISHRKHLKRDLEDLEFFLSDAKMAIKEGPTRPFMDIWFKNDLEGIIIGSFGMIFYTVDGGIEWKPALDRIDNPEGLHYYGMGRCGETLFIVGERGMIFRSMDYGLSWESLNSPYEGSFFGVACKKDEKIVVAFGLRGNSFLSTDSGSNWKAADTPKGAPLSGAVFLSDGSLLMVANDGALIRSMDAVDNFTPLAFRFPGGIAMTETGDGNVVVVGLSGVKRFSVNKLIN